MQAQAIGALGATDAVAGLGGAGGPASRAGALGALGALGTPGSGGPSGTLATPEAMRAFGAGLAEGPPPVGGVRTDALGGFGALFANGLESVNARLQAADAGLQGLALGNAGSLHEVMIRVEEADIAMRFVMQVRTRLLEAYQDVMRMQV